MFTRARADETRERLLAAARNLVGRDGATDLRMEDVAQAAGVSRATLYYHFRDRFDLLRALLDRDMEELGGRLRAAADGGPPEALVSAVVRFFGGNQPLYRLIASDLALLGDPRELACAVHVALVEPVRERLQRGIATGELRPLDAELAACALLGGVRDVVVGRLLRGVPLDLDHLEAELGDLFLRSVAPDRTTS